MTTLPEPPPRSSTQPLISPAACRSAGLCAPAWSHSILMAFRGRRATHARRRTYTLEMVLLMIDLFSIRSASALCAHRRRGSSVGGFLSNAGRVECDTSPRFWHPDTPPRQVVCGYNWSGGSMRARRTTGYHRVLPVLPGVHAQRSSGEEHRPGNADPGWNSRLRAGNMARF